MDFDDKKVCLILPVSGSPFIAEDKRTDYKDVKEILGGYLGKIDGGNLYINPTIYKKNEEWNSVNGLLMFGKNKNEYEFYIAALNEYIGFNENVFYSSSDRFKLIQSNQFYRSSVSDLIRGEIVIIIKEKYLHEFNIPYKQYPIKNKNK